MGRLVAAGLDRLHLAERSRWQRRAATQHPGAANCPHRRFRLADGTDLTLCGHTAGGVTPRLQSEAGPRRSIDVPRAALACGARVE